MKKLTENPFKWVNMLSKIQEQLKILGSKVDPPRVKKDQHFLFEVWNFEGPWQESWGLQIVNLFLNLGHWSSKNELEKTKFGKNHFLGNSGHLISHYAFLEARKMSRENCRREKHYWAAKKPQTDDANRKIWEIYSTLSEITFPITKPDQARDRTRLL